MSTAKPQPALAALAASMILVREQPGFQVLMVRRHEAMAFGAGALVFPGGRIDPGDGDPGWAAHCDGWDGLAAEERALRIAALRETFEETGVLLAKADKGGRPDDRALAEARRALDRGGRSLREIVTNLGLRLDLACLASFARWITPAHMPRRFDTWFYLAVAEGPERAIEADGRETVEAEWLEPREALRLAACGERKLMFPTRMNLQLLAESRSAEEAMRAARTRRIVPVQPWIETRETGAVLTIPPDAGYGRAEEPLDALA